MDIHRKRYILLQNLVGHLQERSILSFGARKSTPTQLSKGELLEALPDTEQPDDSTRIALAGIDRKNVRLECRTLDITRLTNEDDNLLLAISSAGLRYQTFVDRKRLDFGRQISPGSNVFVEVKGISRKVFGVVWYIGELGATSEYPATHALFKSTAPVVRGPHSRSRSICIKLSVKLKCYRGPHSRSRSICIKLSVKLKCYRGPHSRSR